MRINYQLYLFIIRFTCDDVIEINELFSSLNINLVNNMDVKIEVLEHIT